jgi:hypothetical protein
MLWDNFLRFEVNLSDGKGIVCRDSDDSVGITLLHENPKCHLMYHI